MRYAQVLLAYLLGIGVVIAPIPFSSGKSKKVPSSCSNPYHIALTFHQGPSRHTSKLLDILKDRGAVATFYVSMANLSAYEALPMAIVRRAHREGHVIGCSLDQSVDITKYSDEEILEWVATQTGHISEIIEAEVKHIYLPRSSKIGTNYYDLLVDNGYYLVEASMDTKDYEGCNPIDTIMEALDGPAAGTPVGYIISQMDLLEESIDKAGDVVDYIRSRGYELVRMDVCIGKPDGPSIKPPPGPGPDRGPDRGQKSSAWHTKEPHLAIAIASMSIAALICI